MNLLFFLHPGDAAGLAALFNRMHLWGQLNWYDMDAVFKDVEEPRQRMYFVFPLPGFDWRTFIDLLQRLMNEGNGAVTYASEISVIAMTDAARRTYSLEEFFKVVGERGAP